MSATTYEEAVQQEEAIRKKFRPIRDKLLEAVAVRRKLCPHRHMVIVDGDVECIDCHVPIEKDRIQLSQALAAVQVGNGKMHAIETGRLKLNGDKAKALCGYLAPGSKGTWCAPHTLDKVTCGNCVQLIKRLESV